MMSRKGRSGMVRGAFFLSSFLFSHTVALRVSLLLLGAAFVVAAIVKDRRSISILPPLWPFFALWAAWAALSFFWSQDPARSEKEFVNEIVYTALALCVCYLGAQARDAARIILPVFACAAALVCAVALYYFPRGPETYGIGWHGGPGDHSSALLTPAIYSSRVMFDRPALMLQVAGEEGRSGGIEFH